LSGDAGFRFIISDEGEFGVHHQRMEIAASGLDRRGIPKKGIVGPGPREARSQPRHNGAFPGGLKAAHQTYGARPLDPRLPSSRRLCHHTGNLDLPLTRLRAPAGFEMIALNVLG
jgi:hypothetical protein